MIKDTKVVDLAAWKRKKEEAELDALRVKVDEIIEEYGDELEPKMYHPSVYTDMSLGAFDWLSIFGLGTGGYMTKKTNELNTHDIVLEPTKESCTKTLAWVSYILNDMGMVDASNMVEEVIRCIDEEDA